MQSICGIKPPSYSIFQLNFFKFKTNLGSNILSIHERTSNSKFRGLLRVHLIFKICWSHKFSFSDLAGCIFYFEIKRAQQILRAIYLIETISFSVYFSFILDFILTLREEEGFSQD